MTAGKCDMFTTIDEPNALDLSFSLNEESNHQNTVPQKEKSRMRHR